jgi:phosphate-selective porin OprO/OprP
VISVLGTTAAAQTQGTGQVTAGWQEGFFVGSANGDFRLGFGLVAQGDARSVLNDDEEVFTDTFTIRKARPSINGRLARYFDFLFMPDFGSGATVIQDAYVDARFSNAFRLRVGKAKTPIGYEILMGDPYVLFPERALASGLMPNRDVGFQAMGDLAGGRVSYAGGVFNGIPDGSSAASDVDANDSKDVAGRFVVQPFRRATNPGRLNALGFALGGSRGGQRGALPLFRTSVGQRYFGYASTATADGARTRITPSAFYYYDALALFAEYMRSQQPVRTGAQSTGVENHAWQVTAAYVVTGETGADRGVRPRVSFDPAAGEWGALQVLARYSHVSLDEAAFTAGLAAAGSSQQAESYSFGVNWYPAYYIKYQAAFERTSFDGGLAADRHPEHSVIVRAQVSF